MPDDADLLQGGDLVRIPFTSRRPDIVYMGEEKPSLLGSGFSRPAIASFQALKERYFGTTDKGARELAFRYAILADFQDFDDFVRPLGGVTDVPLVAETATRSTLTTPGGLDGDGDGRADLPDYVDNAAWVMVESTTSGGPFQLREVQSIVDLAGGAIEVTIRGTPFHPVPQPGVNFAFLHTSSGRAEIAFQGSRPDGDNQNFNTLPGNDFLVTTAGLRAPSVFRRQRFVTIGPFFRNTFIHELGHTLGLKHGGIDGCQFRADQYFSLMSYSHQLRVGVIFSATDGLTGRELWFSDGTEVGTEQVIDLQPGSASSSPQVFAVRDGVLLFFAFTSPEGWRLWKTDGSAANTEVVADVANPNLSAGVPGFAYNHFTTFQGYHYFAGYTADEADELWRTDGTTGGTELVKILRPGSFGSRPGQFTVVGNKLFFTAVTNAGEELWVTDGTSAGTVGPIEIARGSEGSLPRDLIAIGDRLVFTAFNGNRGREWFASDGTIDGTILLKDIRAGSLSSYILEPTLLGNEVFFTADDGIHGRELWRTDGTPEGTVIVEDLLAGPSSSSPQKLLALDGMLYYFADDGGEMLSLRRLDPGVTTPLDKWLDDTSDLVGDDRDPMADPNNNNQSTLFDYATGVDAGDPDAESVEVFTLSQPETVRMVLRFPRWRDRDRRRLSYDLEFSVDGNNWIPVSLEDAPVRVLSEDFEEVLIEIDCSPETGMMRALFHLRISQGEW